MKPGTSLSFLACLVVLFSASVQGQGPTVSLTKLGEYYYQPPFSFFHYSVFKPHFDRQEPRYLYAASSELGLVVFDVLDPAHPVPVDSLPVSLFHGLKVMNIEQQGSYLFLALGSYEGIPQNSGIAIVDATVPGSLLVTDVWDSAGVLNRGCVQVLPDGNDAYMSVMDSGVVILDISDVTHIRYRSRIRPELNWPVPAQVPFIPHARGLAIRDTLLFVAYDAGGLRVIDVSDKLNPVETGRYRNTSIESAAHLAYNAVVLTGNYAYCTVDYCGLDVVNISSPAAMTTHSWYNPWNCDDMNWSGRPGHSNQLVKVRNDSILLASAGDSEILVFGIAPPGSLDTLGKYAVLQDSIACWGIDAWGNKIATGTLDVPIPTPYVSVHGGVQLYAWNLLAGTEPVLYTDGIHPFPNPAQDILYLSLPDGFQVHTAVCYNLLGERIPFAIDGVSAIPVSHYAPGMYTVCLVDAAGKEIRFRWIKN